ncbi:MAG: tetratricopeptide (TPR) repeat protein [Saprospiraceae bacterium]|jgi:tetratricopeptide (TPR) repeat protein
MKKHFAYFFSVILCLSVHSKELDSSIDSKPEYLIKNGKFASAWTEINKNNNDSSALSVIKKSTFCLKYFSHTSYHLKFYFVDIDSNETLLSYRQKELSTGELFASFNPEKELLKALRKDESNPELHFALGTYYYDVFLSYHNKWKKGTKETMALFYYHFMEAYKQNKKSHLSCYAISYFHQSRRTNAKAKSFLLEALKINPKYAAAHYNLAYSYSVEDSTELAITHANEAYKNYEIQSLKAEAASMCGILYGDLGKHEDAVNWMLISDALAPGNVMLYETLLTSYLALGKDLEAALIAKNLYAYDWRTGRVFNSILDAYMAVKKTTALQLFLENEIESEPVDKEYQGFTYMHLTQMHLNLDQGKQAKENLVKAKASFDICYDKDHAIYRVLEKLDRTIKK